MSSATDALLFKGSLKVHWQGFSVAMSHVILAALLPARRAGSSGEGEHTRPRMHRCARL